VARIEAATGKNILETTGGLIIAGATTGIPIHGAKGFLEETIRCAKKFGIRHSVLDTNQIKSRFPQFNLIGDEQAYYEPMMVSFVRNCASSASFLSGETWSGDPKERESVELIPSSHEVLIRTSSGQYTAEKVVVSAGSWITQFLGQEFAGSSRCIGRRFIGLT